MIEKVCDRENVRIPVAATRPVRYYYKYFSKTPNPPRRDVVNVGKITRSYALSHDALYALRFGLGDETISGRFNSTDFVFYVL